MALTGWKQLQRMRGHEARIVDVVWSPDASRLVSFDEWGQFVIWNARTGKPIHALQERSGAIRSIAWAPSGDAIILATANDLAGGESDPFESEAPGSDNLADALDFDSLSVEQEVESLYLRVVDVDSGLHIGAMSFLPGTTRPSAVIWPRPDRVYTASAGGVYIWQAEDGHYLGRLEDSQREDFYCIAATIKGDKVAAGGRAGNIMIWDSETGETRNKFESEFDRFRSISLAPGYDRLAVGGEEGIVEVWNYGSDEPDLRALEAHSSGIVSTSFSADGKLLATGSEDGTVKLWNTSDWNLVSELPRTRGSFRTPAHFSPAKPSLIAGAINGDRAARIWEVDFGVLAARRKRPKTVHYTNAKVVLLGDTGVGKTGLGLVLSGQTFRATESTHQRNVWPLHGVVKDAVATERREVFLWDLAGQPGYRLLHQLHLADVAVALVVFDGKSELDPLSGVRHWARALNQVSRQARREQYAIARILVAARLDRGRARASDDEIRRVRSEFGFDKYVTTSAKEGEGIAALLRDITESIDWGNQPRVSSTRLFDAIRGFLLQKGETEVVLATEAELRQAFVETGAASSLQVNTEFRICVDRAQARGLVRRFSFGDLVLLKPEILDAYAAAVLHAAGEPDGPGEISEARVREAQFDIPKDSRLADQETEGLLLIATIEDLLRHEVALREYSGDGPYLVFPTQVRQQILIPKSLQAWCKFRLEGPIQHVWATLVVRIAHSGVFVRDTVGQDCALFRSGGDSVAVQLHLIDEGEATIHLFGEAFEPSHTDRLLERFVEAHLQRRAVWDSVSKSRLIVCHSCGFVVPDALVDALENVASFNCPKCPAKLFLREQAEAQSDVPSQDEVLGLELTADHERSRSAARTAVQGKAAVREFDTFLAYNSADLAAVRALRDRLHDFGLNPWMDKDQVPPGRWVQDVLEDAIGKSASAVICIGPSGLGKWQAIELKAFVKECVEEKIPVIPALLPNTKMPVEARFLRELEYVSFVKSVDEDEPLRRLVWGITGDKGVLGS